MNNLLYPDCQCVSRKSVIDILPDQTPGAANSSDTIHRIVISDFFAQFSNFTRGGDVLKRNFFPVSGGKRKIPEYGIQSKEKNLFLRCIFSKQLFHIAERRAAPVPQSAETFQNAPAEIFVLRRIGHKKRSSDDPIGVFA